MALTSVILAGGLGTRMQSAKPKVLHELAGKPLLHWVIDLARACHSEAIHVVHGAHGEALRDTCEDNAINWIAQPEPLGTGHAVRQALPWLESAEQVLILSADVPLIDVSTIRQMQAAQPTNGLVLLTAVVGDPTGLGRIQRAASGAVTAIIEERDACEQSRAIQEIYAGIMLIPGCLLQRYLPRLVSDNAQQEYYLTDVVKHALADGIVISSVVAAEPMQVQGVNSRQQLIALERYWQIQQAQFWLQRGVTIIDPQRFDVRGELDMARDVLVDINCIFSGRVVVAEDCVIEANCQLHNVTLAKRVRIKANSILQDCHIEEDSVIGPFARLRPGTHCAKGVRIGNFVEVKQSYIGPGSKVNHLSYLGDSELGTEVNVGAGSITCNYDGAHKHKTYIEDKVFVGSGTQMVAPLRIGEAATIGAGSTIRKDVPAGCLAISFAPQRIDHQWTRPSKEK